MASTEQVVRLDGAVKVVAGLSLATGKFPRLAALALIGSLVPTTFAGHRFWEKKDPVERRTHLLHFLKNASSVGGLILAAVDTEGRPSLSYRTKRAARQTKRTARRTKRLAGLAPHAVKHASHDLRVESELAVRSAADAVRSHLPG